MFVLVNPDVKHPYEVKVEESELSPTKDAHEIFEEFMRSKTCPAQSVKYGGIHFSIWKRVMMLCNVLTMFDFDKGLNQ